MFLRIVQLGENITEEKKLTTEQAKAIPVLLSAKSYEQGCKDAKISKSTFYSWMQDENFTAEFDRQRSDIVDAAFGMIAQNIEKAISTLVGLLDTSDERDKLVVVNAGCASSSTRTDLGVIIHLLVSRN